MVVALKGAVITYQDDDRYEYRVKCDQCNAVSNNTHVHYSAMSRGQSATTFLTCEHCHNLQEIILQGG